MRFESQKLLKLIALARKPTRPTLCKASPSQKMGVVFGSRFRDRESRPLLRTVRAPARPPVLLFMVKRPDRRLCEFVRLLRPRFTMFRLAPSRWQPSATGYVEKRITFCAVGFANPVTSWVRNFAGPKHTPGSVCRRKFCDCDRQKSSTR